jgi:LCP family protein required for cell wall assembly
MSHRANLFGRGYSDRDADPPRMRYRRAVAAALITIVAPGSAQAILGNKLVGRIALGTYGSIIAAGLWGAYQFNHDRARVFGWAVNPHLAFGLSIFIAVAGIGWLLLFIDAWRLAQTDRLPQVFRWIATSLNLAIITAAVCGTALTARLLTVEQDVVTKVFTQTKVSNPLHGRYNVLLMGSDSGSDRIGTRPDSLTVANIDADSGRTVLVSLPRNLQKAQFDEGSPMRRVWPNGFDCGQECLINAVYADAVSRPGLYPPGVDAGIEATIDAVEGSTGLAINYYVLINLQGFESLVNAVGGVTVDVKTRIAKFGSENTWRNDWIEPGIQKLNGKNALWFGRSRYGSDDYGRMARQKCLMVAMLDQLDPRTVLLNASAIGESSKKLMATSIPRTELGGFADLSLKARDTRVKTVSLVPPAVDPLDPDWDAVRALIHTAIFGPEKTAHARSGASEPKSSSDVETGSASDPGQTDDLKSAC